MRDGTDWRDWGRIAGRDCGAGPLEVTGDWGRGAGYKAIDIREGHVTWPQLFNTTHVAWHFQPCQRPHVHEYCHVTCAMLASRLYYRKADALIGPRQKHGRSDIYIGIVLRRQWRGGQRDVFFWGVRSRCPTPQSLEMFRNGNFWPVQLANICIVEHKWICSFAWLTCGAWGLLAIRMFRN